MATIIWQSPKSVSREHFKEDYFVQLLGHPSYFLLFARACLYHALIITVFAKEFFCKDLRPSRLTTMMNPEYNPPHFLRNLLYFTPSFFEQFYTGFHIMKYILTGI